MNRRTARKTLKRLRCSSVDEMLRSVPPQMRLLDRAWSKLGVDRKRERAVYRGLLAEMELAPQNEHGED